MHPRNLAVIGVTFGAGAGPASHDVSEARAALDEAGVAAMRTMLSRRVPWLAHLVLATCCRTELVLEGPDLDIATARQVWETAWSVRADGPVAADVTVGGEAEQYLFELACGLHSPMLGDTELLGQLRRAWRDAADAGCTSDPLDRVLRLALDVGARARLDTEIAAGGAGVAGAVLDLVAPPGSDRSAGERPVLVIGAGSAGRAVARRLTKHRVGPITVANRTPTPAEQLADEIGGRALPLGHVPDELHRAAVVVSAVPRPVLTGPVLERAKHADPDWEPVLVDVASPERSIHAVEGLTIVRLDDLQARRDAVVRRREASIPAVRRLVARQLAARPGPGPEPGPESEPEAEPEPDPRPAPSLGEIACVS